MKIDRLLKIIIYLLNHETVTAKQLAQKFEVSVKTIQRDMESISLSGVPIVSSVGSTGGYALMSDYKIRNQFLKKEDFKLIIIALKSLNSSFDNSGIDTILEKYLALNKEIKPKIFLDYSVTKENCNVQNNNKIIEEGITDSIQMEFDYKNTNGYSSRKRVCPLALKFKWYAGICLLWI